MKVSLTHNLSPEAVTRLLAVLEEWPAPVVVSPQVLEFELEFLDETVDALELEDELLSYARAAGLNAFDPKVEITRPKFDQVHVGRKVRIPTNTEEGWLEELEAEIIGVQPKGVLLVEDENGIYEVSFEHAELI